MRAWLREQFERPEWKRRILRVCRDDPRFFAAMFAQAYGNAPQPIQLTGPTGGPIVVDFGDLDAHGAVSGIATVPAGVSTRASA
jgi:hypothetical protein